MLPMRWFKSPKNDLPYPPGLGRLPEFDERSRNYQIRPLLAAATQPRKNKPWRPGTHTLDQGPNGACVGFSLAHRLNSSPVRHTQHPASAAFAFYREAKKIDEWPGEDYSGTSILAGCKILKQRGHIDAYRWCGAGSGDVMGDVVDALGYFGPVVIGVNWYTDMFRPQKGLVRPGGQEVGGHAVCVLAQRTVRIGWKKEDVVVFQNSWGPGWGIKWYGLGGHAMMLATDLEALLENRGEAVVLSEPGEAIARAETLDYP